MFIPFLNILISHLDKKMHGRLVLLCLFTYTLMGTIHCIMQRDIIWRMLVSMHCLLYWAFSLSAL